MLKVTIESGRHHVGEDAMANTGDWLLKENPDHRHTKRLAHKIARSLAAGTHLRKGIDMVRRSEQIELENVNHPGQVKNADAQMYEAMKRAFLKILPKTTPGLTVAEIQENVIAHLPEELFPGGAKAGWWTKAVQLDLEAKGIIFREKTRPLRLRKAGGHNGGIMPTRRATPKLIDEYIASFPPEVQAILQKIRFTIRNAAPDAQETISYKIPAYTLSGALVYFAAFKSHIGFYPPVRGDARLEKAISTYAGEKGNLRFPLDQPVPYGLIERIVKLRVKQNLSKAASST